MWAGVEDEYQPDNAETHISYAVIWTVSHLQKINNIFSELTGNFKFPMFPMLMKTVSMHICGKRKRWWHRCASVEQTLGSSHFSLIFLLKSEESLIN